MEPGEEGHSYLYSSLTYNGSKVRKNVNSKQFYAWFRKSNSEFLECQELKSHWADSQKQSQKFFTKGPPKKQFKSFAQNFCVLCPHPEISSLPIWIALDSSVLQISAQISPCQKAPPKPCPSHSPNGCFLRAFHFYFITLIRTNSYTVTGMFMFNASSPGSSLADCRFLLGTSNLLTLHLALCKIMKAVEEVNEFY